MQKVVLVILLFAALWSLGPSAARAQEAEVFLDEDALTAYAKAVGAVSHTHTEYIQVWLPSLCWISNMFIPGRRPVPCEFGRPLIVTIAAVPIPWTIHSPRFTVTTAGIRFTAILEYSSGGIGLLRQIDLASSITYSGATDHLTLQISAQQVPVEAVVGGVALVGYVRPSRYYETHISVPSHDFSFSLPGGGSRTISVSPSSVAVQYLSGQVKLTHTFSVSE